MFDNIESFIKSFLKYEEKLHKELDKITISVCKTWYRNLVNRTPVDTGFARMNWHATINKEPPSGSLINPGPSNSFPKPTTPGFSSVKYGDVIYMFNNTSYIEELENGKSRQAPNGMLAISTVEAQEQLRRAIRAVQI